MLDGAAADLVSHTLDQPSSFESSHREVVWADQDDTIYQSKNLNIGRTRQGWIHDKSIADAGDVDMYKFKAAQGDSIRFEIDLVGNDNLAFRKTVKGILRFFSEDGDLLATAKAGSNKQVFLEHTFDESGNFYVGVSGRGNGRYDPEYGNGDVAGSQGGYRLKSKNLRPDTDDQVSEARRMGIGSVRRGRIFNGSVADAGDVDMFRFRVEKGQTVEFNVEPRGNNHVGFRNGVNPMLRLFHSDGTQLRRLVSSSGDKSITFQHTFDESGEYFMGVSGRGNNRYSEDFGTRDKAGSEGQYVLSSRSLNGDANADKDDSIQEAERYVVGTEVNGSIENSNYDDKGDVDFFRFSVGKNETIQFKASQQGNSSIEFVKAVRSLLKVYDDNGNTVAEARSDSGKTIEFQHTFDSAGEYFLGVSGVGNENYNPINGNGDVAGSEGDYRMSTRKLVQDFDDQMSEAVDWVIESGEIFGEIESDSLIDSADVDVLAFTAAQNETIQFTVLPTVNTHAGRGMAVQSHIKVFDESGNVLSEQIADSNSKLATLQYTFSSKGNYFLSISGKGNDSYEIVDGSGDSQADDGAYKVKSKRLFEDTDDQISEARSLKIGAAIEGDIDSADLVHSADVDVYKFDVLQNETVEFFVSQIGNNHAGFLMSVQAEVKIFDADGNELLKTTANPNNKQALLQHKFDEAGEYFVSISGVGNSGFNALTGEGDQSSSEGQFTLRTKKLFADNDDQISEATQLTIGKGLVGNIDSVDLSDASDVDMYKFNVHSNESIEFKITPTSNSHVATLMAVKSVVRIFDGNGNELVHESYDGNRRTEFEFQFSKTGEYFMSVSGAGNTSFDAITGKRDAESHNGNYMVSTQVLATDRDDQLAEANQIGIGQSVVGSIDASQLHGTLGDVDMYSFDAKNGQSMTFKVQPKDNTHTAYVRAVSSYVRIFDSSGNELTSKLAQKKVAEFDFQFTSTGTYFVAVSGYSNRSFDPIGGNGDVDTSEGDYSLTISL